MSPFGPGSCGYEPMVKVASYATKVDVHNVGMISHSMDFERVEPLLLSD